MSKSYSQHSFSEELRNLERPEEKVEEYLHIETNKALTMGGLIASGLGLLNFIVLFVLSICNLVQNLWLACICALIAGIYSFFIYLYARKGKIYGPFIYWIFIPFTFLPTAFYMAAHFFLPAGAASYITGPFSYLYFVIIVITGFLFTPRLAYLAGLLSGFGYFIIYLLARNQLDAIVHADPTLTQDLSNPGIYIFKSIMMIFCGFLVGTLSKISKKLIIRVLNEEEEKILISNTFGMIVDPRVRDRMIQGKIELGGETRSTTVLFTDIRGFTTFSQSMTPKELLNFMKEFFDLMSEVLKSRDGTIIEYVGDEIMVLFGAPLQLENHAQKACNAALEMQAALKKQRIIWEKEGKPSIHTGIGVHTGSMLVGNIGSTERYKYGAIGDNVNLGSRLQGLTKDYGVAIIASEESVKEVKDSLYVRELDCVTVRGRTCAVRIFELVDFRENEPAAEKKELIATYERALRCYYDKDNARALELFHECVKLVPDDGPSLLFVKRLESM